MNKNLDNSELFCILVKTKRRRMASKLKRMMGNNAHWTINKHLVQSIGLSETLVLQHLIDWSDYHKSGEIFQTYEQMIEQLTLSEYAIKQSVKKLKELNLISVERKGVGYKNYYLLHEDEIYHILQSPTSQMNSPHQSEVTSDNTNSTMSGSEINSLKGEMGGAINKNITNKNVLGNKVAKKNVVKQEASVSSYDSPDGKLEVSPIKYSANKMDEFHNIFNDFQ